VKENIKTTKKNNVQKEREDLKIIKKKDMTPRLKKQTQIK